ncbi:MAG: flavodoxin family protein [Salinivirgaceae bacterium]
MKTAVIFYQSKTGNTKKYAEDISAYIQSKNIKSLCVPVEEYKDNMLQNADFVLLGCWTQGLMIFLQKPDKTWSNFAKNITIADTTKVALFATYKLRTGSMFKNMTKNLRKTDKQIFPTLKSKNGKLSENDMTILDKYLSSNQN